MRIELMMIALVALAFNAAGCSQPEPVEAEYEPANCDCVETTTTETPPAKTDGLADELDDEDEPEASAMLAENSASQDVASDAPTPTDEARAAKKSGDGDAAPSGVVNLNTASVDQLMALPGVGPSLAARIVEFRQKRRFEKPAHLLRVKGIGQAKFAKLEKLVSVSGPTTLAK